MSASRVAPAANSSITPLFKNKVRTFQVPPGMKTVSPPRAAASSMAAWMASVFSPAPGPSFSRSVMSIMVLKKRSHMPAVRLPSIFAGNRGGRPHGGSGRVNHHVKPTPGQVPLPGATCPATRPFPCERRR